MSNILKSAPSSEVFTPTAYPESDLNFSGRSADLMGSINPSSIINDWNKKVIDSDILPTIPPPPPTLVSPGSESLPGPVITTSTPTFEWAEVSEASDYGIYISDLTSNVLIFNSQELGLDITGSSDSLPSGILGLSREYMWSMTSHNSAGWGDLATIFYFKTDKGTTAQNIPPAAPTLVSPGSVSSPGPVITNSTPIFKWTEVSGAMDYGIYIRDLTADVLVFNSKARCLKITGSSYSLPSGILDTCRSYLWYMTSHNSAGMGYYGKIFYFQI